MEYVQLVLFICVSGMFKMWKHLIKLLTEEKAKFYSAVRITCLSLGDFYNNCNYVKINGKKQPWFNSKSAEIAPNKLDHIALFCC